MRARDIETTDQPTARDGAADAVWMLLLAAARSTERLALGNQMAAFSLDEDGDLLGVAIDAPDALLLWRPGSGWEPALSETDPRHALIDLYLPICNATRSRPITIGHLGQSLDGFIATPSGDSQFVTGPENILHLHRLRGLCDAIIVGAGTVAADNPQLTTRMVAGPSPLRVILDPTRRLGEHYRVFRDDSASTLYVCAPSRTGPDQSHFGRALVLALGSAETGIDLADLVRLLRDRGCSRIFVEGGGVTISAFLEANLLDRLQMAVAPLIIGEGRPAIRVPAPGALRDCQRPQCRVFRMGGDILFDCDLRSSPTEPAADAALDQSVVRVI
jgi:diaminohydroxyphosphoribosylaminopyrimidine deaminase/5-amino-6-(5-phosphoribosylamino)uracil reductase